MRSGALVLLREMAHAQSTPAKAIGSKGSSNKKETEKSQQRCLIGLPNETLPCQSYSNSR